MNSVKHAKNYTSCDYNCRLLDYIPVASTIDSLVYFIAKAYLALSSDRSKVRLGTCKCHVANKSKLRCVVLLVPVLGNIVVAMFDLCSHFKNSIEKLSNSNKSDVNNKIMSDRILKKN